jgi:hypothetical protein
MFAAVFTKPTTISHTEPDVSYQNPHILLKIRLKNYDLYRLYSHFKVTSTFRVSYSKLFTYCSFLLLPLYFHFLFSFTSSFLSLPLSFHFLFSFTSSFLSFPSDLPWPHHLHTIYIASSAYHDVHHYAVSSSLLLLPRYSVQIYSTSSSSWILSACILSSVRDTRFFTNIKWQAKL